VSRGDAVCTKESNVQSLIPFLTALALGALLSRLAIAIARRLNFLDRPGERKTQAEPIPLLGGVVIFAALLGGLAVAHLLASGGVEGTLLRARWLLAGLWLLILGLVDDRRGLGPLPRLLGQLLALLIFLPELGQWIEPRWLGVTLGGFWLLGLINSINFLDNMDGVASSSGLLTALALALLFGGGGEPLLGAGMAAFAGAIGGFLLWNRPPARLYMGDSGSTFIGLTLGLFPLVAVGRVGLSPWLVPLLLAVPLYDTATVFWIRWREGRRIWVGDRRHSTHRMVDRGAGVPRTMVTLSLWTAAGIAVAMFAQSRQRGESAYFFGAIALAVALFAWERKREARSGRGD
jgi:UDP-GlcNAc:undecaprenyl-phosphate GlcNAc-1-phosphate transferase